MALISCTECRKKVSDKASSCPSCGAPVVAISATTQEVPPPSEQPVRTRRQKKPVTRTGILVVLGFVFACALAGIYMGERSKSIRNYEPPQPVFGLAPKNFSEIWNSVVARAGERANDLTNVQKEYNVDPDPTAPRQLAAYWKHELGADVYRTSLGRAWLHARFRAGRLATLDVTCEADGSCDWFGPLSNSPGQLQTVAAFIVQVAAPLLHQEQAYALVKRLRWATEQGMGGIETMPQIVHEGGATFATCRRNIEGKTNFIFEAAPDASALLLCQRHRGMP